MKKITYFYLLFFLSTLSLQSQNIEDYIIKSSKYIIGNDEMTYLKKEKSLIRYEAVEINTSIISASSVYISFLDQNVIMIKEKVDYRGDKDFSWFASSNESQNQAILTIKGKDVQGVINLGSKLYRIFTVGEIYMAALVDQSKFLPEGCSIPKSNVSPVDTIGRNYQKKMNNVPLPEFDFNLNKTYPEQGFGSFQCKLRVLVMYTIASKNAHSSIENLVRIAIDGMNQSFINSDVNYQIELVYMEEVGYQESGNDVEDLKRFTLVDGFMDNIHNLRENYSADVCVLIAELSQYCGMAAAIKSCSDRSFCIVGSSCAVGNFTFAHEIGHLIGARHDEVADQNISPYSYGHGYLSPSNSYRTIMGLSYGCSHCTRIPWWSNPNKIWGGQPMGTALTNDNVRLLNTYIPNMMSHRPSTGTRYVTQTDINASTGVVYHVNKIETSGNVIIPNGYSWGFIAGNEVSLKMGFETEVGSHFEAKLHPQCGAPDNELCNFSLSFDEKYANNISSIENEFFIYPNPVLENYFIINSNDGIVRDVEFEIINSFGAVVKERSIAVLKEKFFLTSFPSGMYFIKIYDTSDRIITLKIVKI